MCSVTKNHRKTGVNAVALVNRFQTAKVQGPDIIMHQLKSIYRSPFKDSQSHPIHTCFPMIASDVLPNFVRLSETLPVYHDGDVFGEILET